MPIRIRCYDEPRDRAQPTADKRLSAPLADDPDSGIRIMAAAVGPYDPPLVAQESLDHHSTLTRGDGPDSTFTRRHSCQNARSVSKSDEDFDSILASETAHAKSRSSQSIDAVRYIDR